MAKQLVPQRYIFKIHSSRLRRAKWDLTLPLAEARRNGEVVSLGDSQMLRFIDRCNGIEGADEKAKEVRREIRAARKEPNTVGKRTYINTLYKRLDDLQFKKDYVCLIIDKLEDYRRAVKGFKINGVEYVRLLGTNGGIKCSTIVFTEKRMTETTLRRLIDNGRDLSVKLVPAKFEAYRALTCSASIPVSAPKGVAVVPDCMVNFKSDIIRLSDANDGEPVMERVNGADIEMNATDGFGLMLPSLAARWSEELKLRYAAPGMTVRMAWTKGMVYAFDFLQFADEVAGRRTIIDAWGNEVDLSEVELILTTSMVKLWDSYESCASFLSNSYGNGYTFSVTKVCPERLDNVRSLNYQFIQSYDLTRSQIDELIRPTMDEIRAIINGDWRHALLYLKGVGMTESNVDAEDGDFATAIMADPRIYDDPYVKKKIRQMIRKRIDDAKIGVLDVHGNYSMLSGDPYSLCQSMFGLPVTGLLKAGEIYSRYWINDGADEVACFRAPMTHAGNILKARICKSDEAQKWYRHMNTVTVLNSWDTMCAALNGSD